MLPDAKECKQCGWNVALNAPPSTDPGDRKARLGVAAGLFVAYGAMWSLVQSHPGDYRLSLPTMQLAAVAEPVAEVPAPDQITTQPVALSTSAPAEAVPATVASPAALIKIKVVDAKSATVPARDALQYTFELPETDQKCKLIGSTHGIGGFGRNIEVFLLTDDEYVFWHANPVAIAQSSWETYRGSENTLSYELTSAGTYHFIVSNEMSATPQALAVKAQVKCTR
jgi:hypothetical protein